MEFFVFKDIDLKKKLDFVIFLLIQIYLRKYNFQQIDIKLDLHVCYVLLTNIVRNNFFYN